MTIQPTKDNTLTILENGNIVPTFQLHHRSGQRKVMLWYNLFWLGFIVILNLINPLPFVGDLIFVFIFGSVGLFVHFADNDNKWLEIDRVTGQLTIYNNDSKLKVHRIFARGAYEISHSKLADHWGSGGINYYVIIHEAGGHRIKQYYRIAYLGDLGLFKELVAVEYAARLRSAVDDCLDNRPYDAALIRHEENRKV